MDVDSLFEKGITFSQQGKQKEAIECFDKILAVDPNDSIVLCNKAIAVFKMRNYSKSIELYRQSIKLNPHDPTTWFNMGMPLALLGRINEALQAFETCVNLARMGHDFDKNQIRQVEQMIADIKSGRAVFM
jgi:tetratricopeptide (TPR) repeat protein